MYLDDLYWMQVSTPKRPKLDVSRPKRSTIYVRLHRRTKLDAGT